MTAAPKARVRPVTWQERGVHLLQDLGEKAGVFLLLDNEQGDGLGIVLVARSFGDLTRRGQQVCPV